MIDRAFGGDEEDRRCEHGVSEEEPCDKCRIVELEDDVEHLHDMLRSALAAMKGGPSIYEYSHIMQNIEDEVGA